MLFFEILKLGEKMMLKYLTNKNAASRTSHCKFVTKELSKTIILRTKLRNQFLRKRTLESRTNYNELGVSVKV